MKKQKIINRRCFALRFRRFTRKAYAIFNSMHREVTIGRLATYIADCQLRKSTVTLMASLCLTPLLSLAQEEDALIEQGVLQGEDTSYQLPMVQITAPAGGGLATAPAVLLSREELDAHSVRSLSDVLHLVASLDLRVRGVNDVQGDISFMGGGFDQMLVLLNGINITDAQTGHHNLDIPIDVGMVERVEVLSPSALLQRGVVAFCGAVNIVVTEGQKERIMAELMAGSHGTYKGSALVSLSKKGWTHTSALTYAHSNGYMRNTDYRIANLYLQSLKVGERDVWHISLGGQVKDFGSQAFYSVSYPDQFEATRTMTLAASNVHQYEGFRLESRVFGRLHSDRFELFRQGVVEPASWYTGHNYHLTSTVGLMFKGEKQWGRGTLHVGLETRREGIVSNVLGTPYDEEPFEVRWLANAAKYDRSAVRTNVSLFSGYKLSLGDISLSSNLLGGYSTAFGLDYAASVDASWQFAECWQVASSLSRTYRLPTFTDLYYQGANQQSNPDLHSESNVMVDLRLLYSGKAFSFSAQSYCRAGRGIIDWVRRPDEELWISMNHTKVGTQGADLSARYSLEGLVDVVGGSIALCHVDVDAGEFVSGSVMDYLSRKAQLYVLLAPGRLKAFAGLPLRLKIDLLYRHREGGYVDADGQTERYGSFILLNAGVDYTFRRFTFYTELYNLTNRYYRDLGGVPQPGRNINVGVKLCY